MSETTASDKASDLSDWLATPTPGIVLLSFRSQIVFQELIDNVRAAVPERPSHIIVYDPAHPDAPAGTATAVSEQCRKFSATGTPFIFLRPVTGSLDDKEKANCTEFWKNLNFQRETLGALPAQIILCLDEVQRPFAYSYAKDLISWCAPRFSFRISPQPPGATATPSPTPINPVISPISPYPTSPGAPFIPSGLP